MQHLIFWLRLLECKSTSFCTVMKPGIKKLSLIGAVFLTLSPIIYGGSVAVQAETLISQSANNQYPKKFVDQYMKRCIKRATSEGLPAAESQEMCACTVTKFEGEYTLGEFKKLTRDSLINQAAADKLTEVGYACLDELLYED